MRRRALLTGAAALLAAPAIAQPAKATTLRFVPQANLSVLDPVWTTATVTANHGYYVFDTLYACDSQLRPQPQMAEGHEVSDNGRTWRIRLREGLKFHDNTPVRATDCIASLQRWCKRESFGQLLAAVVESWKALDDRTLEIRLTRPFPLLTTAIGKPDSTVAFMMPERLAQTDASKPITEMTGSGPYRFLADEYNSGSHVAYAKFAGYVPRQERPDWGAGGKAAHYERIEWNIIPDAATAAAALQNGEVDWWELPLPDLQPALARHPGIALQIADGSGRLAMMRMNQLHPPFDDLRVRRAVLMAVKQDDYMRTAFGDDTELWTTCPSLFPRHTPYYSDAGLSLMKADLTAARAALTESGYAGQRVVVISPTDYPTIGALGQVTADMLKKLGMNVDLQETDWGTVVQRRASMEPVEKGGWSIFHTTGSAPGYSSPAVSPLVRGLGRTGWFGWWSSPKAEAMTQDWLAATDPAEQRRIALAINMLAMEEVATVPVGQFFLRTAFRRSITGIMPGLAPYPWTVRPA
jgi:peptide/nickel transport system substrate-binding protein